MRSEERHHRLLAEARRRGRVEVATLAVDFGVAPETIRRDLSELERRGLVRRTHGGAYPVESAGFETNLAQRVTLHAENKRRIAAEAVRHLAGAETVFVDEGYTPQLLASLLPDDRPLTVVTASLSTAAAVAESANVTVLLLGGRVRGRTLATVGAWACDMLAGFVIDLAFIGANGISREFGLTTPDPVVADVKAKAVQVSRRRVFLGHHGKFGANSFCRFAEVGDFEAIVTDAGLSSAEAHRYSLLGPQVVRV
ncbi:DeoR/GlpR family DNA-binding transcription regulator [Streptomyces sp. NPDC001941]|uniref:DeoR/GlpR family DNA-binding transcription regulator n=1 Tax=Streptomyces sp. NPDC001941 TaxID=3154659 RepID=UPI003325D78B